MLSSRLPYQSRIPNGTSSAARHFFLKFDKKIAKFPLLFKMSLQACRYCSYSPASISFVDHNISLNATRQGALKGCRWCCCLSEGAKRYEHLWSHLSSVRVNNVHYKLSRPFFSLSTPLKIWLLWPPVEDQAQLVPKPDIEPRDPDHHNGSEIIEVEFAAEKLLLEVSPRNNDTASVFF